MSRRIHPRRGGGMKRSGRERKRRGRSGGEPTRGFPDADDRRQERLTLARQRASAMAKVVKDLIGLLLATVLVAVFAGRASLWVLTIGAILIIGDYVKKVLEPQLRERWIEREVQRELDLEVATHRHQTLGEQSRHIEHLAAGVAHEIRNPITAAKSLVQQMGEDPAATENVEYAHVALEELERVEKSISHLLRFAREEGFQGQPLELDEVVHSALDALRERIDQEAVLVQLRLGEAGQIHGDPEKLRRVVINLIANALDAMSGADHRPVLSIESGRNLAGDEAWLRVRDHGPGVLPEQRDEIWNPFFSSKESGTGLGLALTKKIIEAHGGRIELESPPPEGAAFLVTLPTRLTSATEPA
ncbi:MAG: hypothetical protein GY723_06700 [bacterium]|nr:hypothetical protein [bacterium]MCP5066832.1 hypothetical protein [bacterium]